MDRAMASGAICAGSIPARRRVYFVISLLGADNFWLKISIHSKIR